MTPYTKYCRPLSVSVNARPPLTSRTLESWLSPGSRCAINEFIAHVERVADGTRWLEAPEGGASNGVGEFPKYLWV